MKKLYFLLTFLMFATVVLGQKMDTVVYLMGNGRYPVEKSDSAKFKRVLVYPDNSNDSTLAFVADFYMNGRLKMASHAATRSYDISQSLQDSCVEFYEDGKPKSTCQYNHGHLTGDNYIYFPNGKLYCVTNYGSDGFTYKECHDTSGAYTANHGHGKWLDYSADFKTLVESGEILMGVKDGEWQLNIKGQNKRGVYKAGSFVYGDIDCDDENRIFEKMDERADIGGGINELYNFIAKTLRYPAAARDKNIQGRVIVEFVVEKDGSLTNFKIFKSANKYLDEEALRVSQLFSNFTPARNHGKAVRSLFKMPFNFTLAND